MMVTNLVFLIADTSDLGRSELSIPASSDFAI